MKKYKETGNKFLQGIVFGVGTSVLTGAMVAAISAVLINREILTEASCLYGAYFALLAASLTGCCLAGIKAGERKLPATVVTAGIYFILLLSAGLVVSGGRLTGVAVTGLLITGAGAGSAFMLNKTKKSSYNPRKYSRFNP